MCLRLSLPNDAKGGRPGAKSPRVLLLGDPRDISSKDGDFQQCFQKCSKARPQTFCNQELPFGSRSRAAFASLILALLPSPPQILQGPRALVVSRGPHSCRPRCCSRVTRNTEHTEQRQNLSLKSPVLLEERNHSVSPWQPLPEATQCLQS